MSHYSTAATGYRIVINASTLGGAAPADGFIDNTTMAKYIQAGGSTPNLAQTLAKKRGNSRYEIMVQSSQQSFNYTIFNIVATGGGSTTTPSAFQFDVIIERGDSVLYTNDENNTDQFLLGTAALKRIFARTLMIARTDRCDYIDPTSSNVATGAQDNSGQAGVRRGTVIADVVVAALASSLTVAEAAITITAL